MSNRKVLDRGISKEKTKVLFVIPSFGKGGAERVLSILLEHLDRNKIHPFCIIFDSSKAYKIPDDVKVYCLDLPGVNSHLKKIIYTIKRIIRMKRIISIEEPDVVFSFMHTVNLAVLSTRLLSDNINNKVKLIISEHITPSVDIKEEMKRYHGRITKFLIKILYPKADRIIAVSEGVKKDLIEHFNLPEEKIDVIFNPLDIKKIIKLSKEEITEHPWFSDNIPIIVNVGSLNRLKQKGQDFLLKTFRRVREKVRSRLVILGEGEKENELKQLSIDLGISDDVAFLGFQRNPFKFVGKSSVFVLSSRWEGHPCVLIEAMACGATVVSTRCPSGPEEIITDSMNGLLVPVEDEEKLAEAILKAIACPDMSVSMASEAKITASQFDVKTVIDIYEKLLVS